MTLTLHLGDSTQVLRSLPTESVDCCVTSPPYFGLRDYGFDGQYGLEPGPDEYVANLTAMFTEVRRTLKRDGVLWLNIGDTYSGYHGNARVAPQDAPSNRGGYWEGMRQSLPGGIPAKNLIGIPWRLALALQRDGWILRSEVIWRKVNAKPERSRDRPHAGHETIFLLAKRPRYWFNPEPLVDIDAVGDVWSFPRSPAFVDAHGRKHFAVMPDTLAETLVATGCKPGGVVLDPFNGVGTTGRAALAAERSYVGIDGNPDFIEATRHRLAAWA